MKAFQSKPISKTLILVVSMLCIANAHAGKPVGITHDDGGKRHSWR